MFSVHCIFVRDTEAIMISFHLHAAEEQMQKRNSGKEKRDRWRGECGKEGGMDEREEKSGKKALHRSTQHL